MILKENIDKLHFVANFLIENESMEEYQFVRAMEDDSVTYEELVEMKKQAKRQSEDENRQKFSEIPVPPYNPPVPPSDNLNNQ